MLGKLLLAWLLFRKEPSASAFGQGGIRKQATLKGRDGRIYRLTLYNDKTALCDTDKAVFYFVAPGGPALKVIKGDAAAVADALANLPE